MILYLSLVHQSHCIQSLKGVIREKLNGIHIHLKWECTEKSEAQLINFFCLCCALWQNEVYVTYCTMMSILHSNCLKWMICSLSLIKYNFLNITIPNQFKNLLPVIMLFTGLLWKHCAVNIDINSCHGLLKESHAFRGTQTFCSKRFLHTWSRWSSWFSG